MVRELIFRAWDKNLNIFRKFGMHKFSFLLDCTSGILESSDYDSYDMPTGFQELSGRFVLEQYTGLTDKNGKKIFENDICTREDGEKGRIIFYANSWCLDMSPFYPLCREGWCEGIIGHPSLEIIGNIHENPELMEVSK